MARIRISRVTGSGPRIQGSGKVATESRDIGEIRGVSVSGLGHVVIRSGESESLTITADDNILPLLTSQVADGRLVLGVERNAALYPTQQIVYSLTVRRLEEVEASGAVKVNAEGIAGERLEVRLSGAAQVEISGKVDRQILDVSGAARYRATSLESGTAMVDISGAAAVRIRVSDRLEGKVSGAAGLRYTGDPEVAIKGRRAVKR